jgi:hypothetical protein
MSSGKRKRIHGRCDVCGGESSTLLVRFVEPRHQEDLVRNGHSLHARSDRVRLLDLMTVHLALNLPDSDSSRPRPFRVKLCVPEAGAARTWQLPSPDTASH